MNLCHGHHGSNGQIPVYYYYAYKPAPYQIGSFMEGVCHLVEIYSKCSKHLNAFTTLSDCFHWFSRESITWREQTTNEQKSFFLGSPDKEAPLMVSAAAANMRAKLVLSLVKQLSTELMRLVRALPMLQSMTELQVLHNELSHSL